MKKLRLFNPLKEQTINKIHHFIKTLVDSEQQHICFYNDNSGYFSFPFRYSSSVSFAYDDGRFYNLCALLKNDIYLTINAFREMNNTFHWDLIEHFEERSTTEENPIVQSYILFLLSNLSTSDQFQFSDYSKDRVNILKEKIEALDSFFIGNNDIHHATVPENAFVVSYDTEIPNNNGIIITRTKNNTMPLIVNSDRYYLYYSEK